jgi:hypothetical protein
MADPAKDLYSFRRDDSRLLRYPNAYRWSHYRHEPPYPKTSAKTSIGRSPKGREAVSSL